MTAPMMCMLWHNRRVPTCPSCKEVAGEGLQPEEVWRAYRVKTKSERIRSLIDERLEGIATGRVMVKA